MNGTFQNLCRQTKRGVRRLTPSFDSCPPGIWMATFCADATER